MNGERHREDGPAIEYDDGTKELWINGKTIKVAKKSRKPFKSGEKINTVKGGHRRYLQSTINDYLGLETEDGESNLQHVAVYCRVSSQDQKKITYMYKNV